MGVKLTPPNSKPSDVREDGVHETEVVEKKLEGRGFFYNLKQKINSFNLSKFFTKIEKTATSSAPSSLESVSNNLSNTLSLSKRTSAAINPVDGFCEQFFEHFFGIVPGKFSTTILNEVSEEQISDFFDSCQREVETLSVRRTHELLQLKAKLSDSHLLMLITSEVPNWYQLRFGLLLMDFIGSSTTEKLEESILKDLSLIKAIPNYLMKIEQEITSAKLSEKKLHDMTCTIEEFSGIEQSELWRLFIDARDQHAKGKYGYENEPGYLNGCYKGMTLGLAMISDGKRLTFSEIFNIYSETVETAWTFAPQASCMIKLQLQVREETFLNGVENPLSLDLVIDVNASEAGLKEIKDQSTKIDDNGEYKHNKYLYQNNISANKKTLEYGRIALTSDLELIINQLLSDCYSVIFNEHETVDAKQYAIAKCIAHLERMHPFPDGNCRTFVTILGNLLRVQAKLSPLIWQNPNVFDGYSISELSDLQTQASSDYLQIANN